MKRYFYLLAFVFYLGPVHAQLTSGITGKRDTSYSTWSAYNSTRKTHPDIRIVKEQIFDQVTEHRNLVYARIGERPLQIDAFLPKTSTKPAPAILIIHGGGWRSGNRSQHIPLAQHLAAAGYACFTTEYRLSTEALYPAAVDDLRKALAWIKANAKRFDVDQKKLAVLGFSAGGELAAFIGATSGNDVQAIIDMDGTLSFVHPDSGEGDDSRSTSAATYWLGYAKKDNPVLWTAASPLTYARQNKAPFLFLNSAVERMHAGRDDFREILKENGIYTEAHTFEGAPHSFCLFDPWFQPTVHYITTFLHQVFKP
ncbi:esterase [Pedobacter sp. HMWF019]|uniref:alpha/beta hydrolase n=1 Tax=Pedobacter sp. HMWF019 TaxID=2056856 RepID=UPI000D396971|nr:alpha/beta hydrolase [Pedobacter sp. HMWF019]PTT01709.1 esterase [Pedobacter sp. HMWF019]